MNKNSKFFVVGIKNPQNKVILEQAVFVDMFSGLLGFKEDSDEIVGALMDNCGHSYLCEIKKADETLSFLQKYKHLENLSFLYELKKENDYWIGTCKNMLNCDVISVKLILTEISKDFF